MPKIDNTPVTLKPFLFHKVDLQWGTNDKQATADCPWCGREGKFTVEIATGLWRCWSCGTGSDKGGGNIQLFLKTLWEQSDKATTNYREFAASRRLLNPDTLVHWGACQSVTTQEWLLPGYAFTEKGELQLQQLYRYTNTGERFALLPTSGCLDFKKPSEKIGHRLFGLHLYDKEKPEVYLCEGPWDGMSLWEHLASHKLLSKDEAGHMTFGSTANMAASLLSTANVLAVPGCNVFDEAWISLFQGKIVHLMYDNDHPRINPKTNKPIRPGALEAMRRVTELLSSTKRRPKEIRYARWGNDHFNLQLPNGFDVRDYLTLDSYSASS